MSLTNKTDFKEMPDTKYAKQLTDKKKLYLEFSLVYFNTPNNIDETTQ